MWAGGEVRREPDPPRPATEGAPPNCKRVPGDSGARTRAQRTLMRPRRLRALLLQSEDQSPISNVVLIDRLPRCPVSSSPRMRSAP